MFIFKIMWLKYNLGMVKLKIMLVSGLQHNVGQSKDLSGLGYFYSSPSEVKSDLLLLALC